MTTLLFHVRGLIATAVFLAAFLFVPFMGISIASILFIVVRA